MFRRGSSQRAAEAARGVGGVQKSEPGSSRTYCCGRWQCVQCFSVFGVQSHNLVKTQSCPSRNLVNTPSCQNTILPKNNLVKTQSCQNTILSITQSCPLYNLVPHTILSITQSCQYTILSRHNLVHHIILSITRFCQNNTLSIHHLVNTQSCPSHNLIIDTILSITLTMLSMTLALTPRHTRAPL